MDRWRLYSSNKLRPKWKCAVIVTLHYDEKKNKLHVLVFFNIYTHRDYRSLAARTEWPQSHILAGNKTKQNKKQRAMKVLFPPSQSSSTRPWNAVPPLRSWPPTGLGPKRRWGWRSVLGSGSLGSSSWVSFGGFETKSWPACRWGWRSYWSLGGARGWGTYWTRTLFLIPAFGA